MTCTTGLSSRGQSRFCPSPLPSPTPAFARLESHAWLDRARVLGSRGGSAWRALHEGSGAEPVGITKSLDEVRNRSAQAVIVGAVKSGPRAFRGLVDDGVAAVRLIGRGVLFAPWTLDRVLAARELPFIEPV